MVDAGGGGIGRTSAQQEKSDGMSLEKLQVFSKKSIWTAVSGDCWLCWMRQPDRMRWFRQRNFLGVVISIIIFIIIKILVKKLARVFKIPVVKQINKLLGGVLGLAEAAILVFFAVNIFSGVLEFSNPEMLNNPMISGAVFKFFSVAV